MSGNSTIDRMDFAILDCLTKNARISNKELAAAVGLAPSSCHERLKVLREKGVLKGAHAEVDLRALGFDVEALLLIQVGKLSAADVDAYMEEVADIPFVRSVFLISGHFDMAVHVTVQSMEHLKHLISDHFHREFVIRVESSLVFNCLSRRALPSLEGSL